jgi:hypothetical protein
VILAYKTRITDTNEINCIVYLLYFVCNGNVNIVRYNANSDQNIKMPLLSVITNCMVYRTLFYSALQFVSSHVRTFVLSPLFIAS